MDAKLHHAPPARKARVVEPRLVRPIGIVEDEIERMDASKRACGQQVPDLPHRFGMAIAEVYPQKPVGGAGGGDHLLRLGAVAAKRLLRSEERRVGNASVSTCRSL